MTDANDERPGEGVAPNRRSVLQTARAGGVGGASRRGVVAGAIASVAAALGLTGTAAAGVDPVRAARLRRVERRYGAEDVALETLQDRGADVLARLAAEGYLDRGDASELGTPEVNAIETDGTITGHVAARTDLDGDELTVVVEPEAGRQYALLDHDDRDGVTVFDSESSDGPRPLCDTGIGCEGSGCVCDAYEIVSCDEGDCYVNGPAGYQCNSCKTCGSPACGW